MEECSLELDLCPSPPLREQVCLKQGRSSSLVVSSHPTPTPAPTCPPHTPLDQALLLTRGQGHLCALLSTEDSGTGGKGTRPCTLSFHSSGPFLLLLSVLRIPFPP